MGYFLGYKIRKSPSDYSERDCWPSGLRRKAQSVGLSMKRFSVTAVGAPLALGVDAVAVVDDDLHS